MAKRDPWDPRRIILREKLRNARQRAGLTQRELATRIGQDQAWVAKIERGYRLIEAIELVSLCDELDLNLLELLR